MGWKDILRPIRDGFRDQLPPRDDVDWEAKRKQQLRDSALGFTYFDTFEQVKTWRPDDVLPFQRSNTPLLPRPPHRAPCDDALPTAKVLLCHDFSGGYHPYEASQPSGIGKQTYSCEYFQFVDTFVYFSHHLVSIPPAAWINTCHRNGVPVLGTFIVEPETRDIESILSQDSQLHFWVASQLALMADYYGFDGWLLNIEKTFPLLKYSHSSLLSFIRNLRELLGPCGKLIWYDALTKQNMVDYQNGLTEKNLEYALAAGGLLTNYHWTVDLAESSKRFAIRRGMAPEQIYFGIDVFAQQDQKGGPPRITYPEQHGGGTNTGVAVAKLAQLGLSAGVFAPAWPFEHFPTQPKAVERTMWDGEALPNPLRCPCKPPWLHDTEGYRITQWARRQPVGNESFFFTDLEPAFRRHDLEYKKPYDGHEMHSQLSAQAISPHLPHRPTDPRDHSPVVDIYRHPDYRWFYVRQTTEGTLDVVYHRNISNVHRETLQPLYNLDMRADGSLNCQVRCRWSRDNEIEADQDGMFFYMVFEDDGSILRQDIACEKGEDISVAVVPQGNSTSTARLREIGLGHSGQLHHKQNKSCQRLHRVLMSIREISILPTEQAHRLSSADEGHHLTSLTYRKRVIGDVTQYYLSWQLQSSEPPDPTNNIPFSRTSGPYAYFIVDLCGFVVRSYALEYVLAESLLERIRERDVCRVCIRGVTFDGVDGPVFEADVRDDTHGEDEEVDGWVWVRPDCHSVGPGIELW